MARNEFGAEANTGGGFSFGGTSPNLDEMFAEAEELSVVDDELPQKRPRGRNRLQDSVEEISMESPVEQSEPMQEPVEEIQRETPTELSFSNEFGDDSFENAFADVDLDSGDTHVSEPPEEASAPEVASESFEDFGQESDEQESSATDFSRDIGFDLPKDSEVIEDSYLDPVQGFDAADIGAPLIEEKATEPSAVEVDALAPMNTVDFAPQPVPSVAAPEAAPQSAPQTASEAPTETVGESTDFEGSVDYIERVILTSDAIRALEEGSAKAVNLFITEGKPVDSHQELVLAALSADRQILKTTSAILESKSKGSVDRAFYILGLDETTFVDLGKVMSHDLEATQSAVFEGDRLSYARKLVDIVESLSEVSAERFEAVRSVLRAGEIGE